MKTKTVQGRQLKEKVAAKYGVDIFDGRANQNPMLETHEAAAYLNTSAAFLEKDRWRGAVIPFVRIGSGKGIIRYQKSALDHYISSRTEGPKLEA